MFAACLSAAPLPLLPRVAALSLRSLFSVTPPLSLSRRSSPAPPPPQRCSAPPGRRRSAASPSSADRASSLLRSSLHPFLSDIDGRSRDGAARGSASPRRLDLSSLASVRAFADRFHHLPPSPRAAAVAGRPPPPRADRCAARARRAQRHGTPAPSPGRDVGTAALRGTARRRSRAPACRASACPCQPCSGRAMLGRPGWPPIVAMIIWKPIMLWFCQTSSSAWVAPPRGRPSAPKP